MLPTLLAIRKLYRLTDKCLENHTVIGCFSFWQSNLCALYHIR